MKTYTITAFLVLLCLVPALSLPVFAGKEQESEIFNMRFEKLPKIVERDAENDLVKTSKKPQKLSVEEGGPRSATCRSGGTDYLLPETFSCTNTLARSDNLEIPLYTNLEENHAYVEVSFPLFDTELQKKALIEHSFEYPRQQELTVFYRKGGVWKIACLGLRLSQSSGITECPLPSDIDFTQDTLSLRIEGYAREGKSRWYIDHVALVDVTPPELSLSATQQDFSSVILLSAPEQDQPPLHSFFTLSESSSALLTPSVLYLLLHSEVYA